MKRSKLITTLAAALALVAAPVAYAAEGTGVIDGRVFNPATGEYVRNAEVKIPGLNRMVHTESDGTFLFTDVPAGETTLTVGVAGYHPVSESINVLPGRTITREINIVSTAEGVKTADGKIKMSQFVVSSDREGNSKAIMEQRRSMNIINSVASDAFGDITEGNAGEFLKYIPGVELDYVDSLIRAPRLRGMESQYTSVSMDGVRVAAADGQMAYASTENGTSGESVRSPGFEAISLNNIESIEISKTLSPDMDADAPAGSINFKSKRAFERKGRRIAWQTRLAMDSEEFHFKKTYGPADSKTYKAIPGASLEYSDVYMENRLGVVLSVNKNKVYAENYTIDNTVNRTPTASDPRPAVFTSIVFRDVGGLQDRLSTGLAADFKATSNLVLSMSLDHSKYWVSTRNRNVTFTAAANNTSATGRSTIVGSDPLMAFETSSAGGATRRVAPSTTYFNKRTNSTTFVPKLEWRRGPLLIEAKGAYARAKNTYNASADGLVGGARASALTGVDFRLERTDPARPDWKVTQLSGPSWTDLSNFKDPFIMETFRHIEEERYSGQVDASYKLKGALLSLVKVGGKLTEMTRDHHQIVPNFTYVGPGGGPNGSWVGYETPNTFDMGTTGGRFFSSDGRVAIPAIPNLQAIGGLFRQNPDYFRFTEQTATVYYNEKVRDRKHFTEEIPSAYMMANGRVGRVQWQGGVRWEKTKIGARETDPRTRSEVVTAGFPVNASGTPTTVAGMEYQYFSKPLVWRRGRYDNFFPSISGKYAITENLVAHAGYNKAISRPALNHIAGVWAINEDAQTVQVPNPGLLPERSDNYSARVSYYFEQLGMLAVGVFQNDITNLRETAEFTADEFGYGNDPTFSGYRFFTQSNGSGSRRFRGMEVEYTQHLSFLPGPFRGLNVSGSYVRNYASLRRAGLVPHRLSGSIGYKWGPLNLRFSASWADDTPWLTSTDTFQPDKATFDVSGGFQVWRNVGFFFSGRNITDEPRRIYQWTDASRTQSYLYRYGQNGAQWMFGVKGTF